MLATLPSVNRRTGVFARAPTAIRPASGFSVTSMIACAALYDVRVDDEAGLLEPSLRTSGDVGGGAAQIDRVLMRRHPCNATARRGMAGSPVRMMCSKANTTRFRGSRHIVGDRPGRMFVIFIPSGMGAVL